MMTGKLIGWVLVLVAAVLNGCGSLLLKQSAKAAGESLGSQLFTPWFIGGLACYGINVILFGKALKALPVAIAYPVLAGTSLALISLAASILFRERLAAVHWTGAVLVFFGIVLLTRPHSEDHGPEETAPAAEAAAPASVD
jgi:multidrug transporter EmrE-like cation transporter